MKAGLTPRGIKMPQTPEEFGYLVKLFEDGMKKQQREIGQLKHNLNKLQRKLDKCRKKKGKNHESD